MLKNRIFGGICFGSLGFLALSAQAATPVLLVAGGHQSCPTTREILPIPSAAKTLGLANRMETIRQNLSHRGPTRTIYTCFTGILRDLTVDRIDLWISQDKHFHVREEHPLYSSLIRSDDVLLPVYRYIRKVLEQVEEPRLFAIGHSYGGWTAGHVVQHFGSEFETSGLVTLDPISPVTCKPLGLLRSASTFYSPRGCRRAPTDLEVSEIAPKVAFWRNFHQRTFYFLHSGPFPGLDRVGIDFGRRTENFGNQRIRRFNLDAHSALARNREIWRWVAQTATRLWY